MNGRGRRIGLAAVTAVFLLAGSFFTGMGVARLLADVRMRGEYRDSPLHWKRELYAGEDEASIRDLRNQELMANMEYIALEQTIFLETGTGRAAAGIANQEGSRFDCTLTLIRDATGERIYQSGLITPGHYIEYIRLSSPLKKGYYPCTAVWDFYTGEEYAGETAWNVVVVIKN